MSRRPAFLAVDIVGALHIVGTLIAYLSLATLVPAGVALGYGEPVWPFLAAGALAGGVGVRGRAGDARRPPAQRPRGLPRRLADVARRRRARRAAVHLLRRPAGRPARRCVLRGDVRLQHDRRQHRRRTSRSCRAASRCGASSRSGSAGSGSSCSRSPSCRGCASAAGSCSSTRCRGRRSRSLSTRIRDTARRVWILYIALTVVLLGIFLALWATGVDEEMTPFQAFAHAFTTIPTAGFSTKVNSIEAFAPATQWVVRRSSWCSAGSTSR